MHLNCHNLWRIMSKLLALARLQLECQAKRLPIHKLPKSPRSPSSSLSTLSNTPPPPQTALLPVTSVRGGARRHKVCQPGSRDFEWRSPVYSLFAFQPTASIMLSITQLNWQFPPVPSLSSSLCLAPSSALAISGCVD